MNTSLRVLALSTAFALAACGSPHHGPPNPDLNWHPASGMLQKYVTNPDGSLTRAQMDAGLKRDFDAADANHDGCLNADEAGIVNQRRWQEDASTASPLIDWNRDGCINFSEFGMTQRSLFDQLDSDGTGKLTREELHPGGLQAPPPEKPVPASPYGH
ncbi:MAG TPA: hypothetical protein VH000_06640 [Rhizomicrobium sp.]|jgi:hypothetical protein|nr:hypothetical protein [Rhizomicrobium sp.]